MSEYTSENYAWFILNNRPDKLSQHGLELVAKRYYKMKLALEDIATWDEDLSEEWDDPGVRASEALKD